MKVLLVAHAWPDEALGGVELHVRALARELVRRGHQVIAVVGAGVADRLERIHADARVRA